MSNPTDSVNTTEPQVDFAICGWLPWWRYDKAIDEINSHPGVYDVISPFVYELGEDLEIVTKIEQSSMDRLKTGDDFKIIPSISNAFDAERVSAIINSDELTKKHINDIVELTKQNNYDGIEVDYEELYAESRDAYSDFIRELADSLHTENKVLIVTVHPKTSDEGTWNGTQSQDWRALSKSADYVRVMAYDYHWSTSKPGPIAPMIWVREVADYAKRTIPLNKRILAVGLYGYDWVVGTEQAENLSLMQIQNMIFDMGLEPQYSKAYASPKIEYEIDGVEHIIWYENEVSFTQKFDLAKNYFAGICIWSLGELTSSVYQVIN